MFLLALSAWGKLACHGYIMKHVWISAELRGGARRIKRRLAGSIWQGIASASLRRAGHLAHPKLFLKFDIVINFYKILFFVALFVKKWPTSQLTSAAAQQQ